MQDVVGGGSPGRLSSPKRLLLTSVSTKTIATYSTPIPSTPMTCWSPFRPNATYSASAPVMRWTRLWTVPVTKMGLPAASPTIGLLMKPRIPSSIRTTPMMAA